MATVHLSNAAGYAQEIRARTHSLTSDEPADYGGGDTGPAPYELLLAALASCTSLTLRMYADRKQWDLGSIKVDARFARSESGEESIERSIVFGRTLTLEQLTRLADICEKTPVTKTLRQGLQIKTNLGQ
jgi:putative redox protein